MIRRNISNLNVLNDTFSFDKNVSFKGYSYDLYGNSIVLSNIKENVLDTKINKDSVIKLTQLSDLSQYIEISTPFNKNIYKTPIRSEGYKLARYDNNQYISLDNVSNNNNNYIFNVEFINSQELSIYQYKNDNKIYLDPSHVSNSPTRVFFSDTQTSNFRYYILEQGDDIKVIIYTIKDDKKYVLRKNGNQIGLLESNIDVFESEPDIIFSLNKYKPTTFDPRNKEISYNKNEFGYQLDKDNVVVVKNNFLLESPINISDDNNLITNFVCLKNEFNSANNQSNDSLVSNLNTNQFRSYRKIFSGNNQNDGSYNINLSFENFNHEYIFKSGKVTYFNLPQNMGDVVRININSLLFQNQGAIPGKHPLQSDKIFKYKGGYKNTTNSGKTSDERNGTFLCSWLKKTEHGSVWYDRYYFPSKISESSALRSYGRIYQSVSSTVDNIQDNEIYDVISNMTFEPGCHYAYHHVGKSDIENIIRDIDRNLICDKIKQCVFNNTQSVYVFPKQKYKNKLSISLGIDVTKDKFAHNILGNLDNNGIAVYNEEHITPMFFSKKNNYIEVYNNDLKLLHNNKLQFVPENITVRKYMEDILIIGPSSNKKTLPCVVQQLSNKSLYVLTYDMKIKNEYSIPSTKYTVDDSKIIFDVRLVNNEAIYLTLDLDNIDLGYTVHDSIKNIYGDGNMISFNGTLFVGSFDKLMVRNSNIIIGLSKAEQKIYSYDILNNELKLLIRANSDIYDFAIDGNDTYVLYKDSVSNLKRVCILDKDMNYVKDFTNTYNTNTSKIFLTKEFNVSTYEKRIMLYDSVNKQIDKFDLEGNRILSNNDGIFDIFDDCNGNNYYETYVNRNDDTLFSVRIKLKNKITNKIFSNVLSVRRPYNYIKRHYIGISIDSSEGYIKIFLNGALADVKLFEPNQYDLYTTINDSFLLGKTQFFNNVALNEYLDKKSYYVYSDLKLYDVGIYNEFLDETDYLNIYRSYKAIDDMIVNIPIFKNNMIDTIERFFKFKGTGFKSNKFDIVIKDNKKIPSNLKGILEGIIKENIKNLKPVESELNNIKWQ